jgi:hypothetical protein
MQKNNKLMRAKKIKNDEFYTPIEIIEQEIESYYEYDKNVFKDKVIYLNCDDPYESKFFQYFILNFNRFGLKRLIATSYGGSPIAGTMLPLFDELKNVKPAHKIVINEVKDYNNDGATNLTDIQYFLKNNKNAYEILKGDDVYPPGDFRSKECVELLKESDIVVTNPPFSLFRDFVDLLIKYDKKFIVLGLNLAISYKNIFKLFKENKIWFGVNKTEKKEYIIPNNNYEIVSMRNTMWFTNIKHSKTPEKLILMSMKDNLKYNVNKIKKYPYLYKEYDNFHAIEVPEINLIPNDYEGIMGVPFTILYRYNPEQFEILTTDRLVDEFGYSFLKKKNCDTLDCKINNKQLFRRVFIKLKNK